LQRGAHRSLRAAIYDVLKENIVTGRFTPGKFINLTEVQRDFGVGLSAVREALCQLAADGLVIAEDQRGFRAAPISAKDLSDLTCARIEIEQFTIRDAIAHGDVHWEAQVIAEFHKLQFIYRSNRRSIDDQYRLQHRIFHDALVAACQSEWMRRFRSILHEHSERYRQVVVQYSDHPRDIIAEHRGLMDAALARDGERAAELIAEHINQTAEIILRLGIAERPQP
jgi:DNA-binding GntR family transcriptional regulator